MLGAIFRNGVYSVCYAPAFAALMAPAPKGYAALEGGEEDEEDDWIWFIEFKKLKTFVLFKLSKIYVNNIIIYFKSGMIKTFLFIVTNFN